MIFSRSTGTLRLGTHILLRRDGFGRPLLSRRPQTIGFSLLVTRNPIILSSNIL
jgi:hypothetical protein